MRDRPRASIEVVDAFAATTPDRPDRHALPPAAARATLGEERGRQFDLRVVGAHLAVLAERP